MSNQLDTVTNLYAAFARGDVFAVLGAMAPDIRWTEAEGFPYGGTYIGPDAVLQNVFMRLGSEWDGFAAIAHELIPGDNTIIALGDYSGTYKATEKSFKAPFVHVWRLDGDKIISFVQHTDTAVVQRAMQ